MLPLIMEISGNKDAFKKNGVEPGNGPVDEFIAKMELFIKSFPDVYEEIKNANYQDALMKGMANLWSNMGQKYLKELVLLATGIQYQAALRSGINVPKLTLERAEEILEKPLAILKAVDLVLLSGDFVRITANITSSRQMEEWKLTARGANVTLLPELAIVVPYEQLKITAQIKNFTAPDDTHAFYEWKTSGKLGKLSDTKGHANLNSFNSEDKEVYNVSKVSNSSLSDGENLDYIYVTAFYGSTKIGSDTITVNVQKEKYLMKPDGITVSGKDGSYSEVVLYLEKSNGYNGIESNDSADYKVVWTTSGKYGKLSGRDIVNANSVTAYNDNWVIYECLDSETKEGNESVKAQIYLKNKSEPESEYRLIDEATGTIKINYDKKKKIIHKKMTYHNGCWEAYNCYTYPVAIFDVDTAAKKYSARFYNFTGTKNNIPPNGYTYTWGAGQRPPTTYSIWPDTKDIYNNQYWVAFGRTWCDGVPGGTCNISATGSWEANYKKLYGPNVMVEITYYY